MNLTVKDKEFLEQLEPLVENGDIAVELRTSPFKHFVLRKNYGDHIQKNFRMTRQGVRWRFQRVFSGIYVSALETILTIERAFGTSLRDDAIQIARERYLRRKQATAGTILGENVRKHKS